MLLNVSKIQHFSVGDGEGIRTTVFFKGCNLKCPWCHNPENFFEEPVTLKYEKSGKTEVCGRFVTVDDIMPELLEDIDFFKESNGGITLSGGEVMLQPEGVKELVAALKEKGVSVLIDTAGSVPYSSFEKINNYVDGYLFDYKTADKEKYTEIDGDLELIEKNIIKLIKSGKRVIIRIPLIPDFNTEDVDIEKICKRLKSFGIKEVDLLPFHRLGSAKYEALGMKYKYKDYEPFSKEKLNEIKFKYAEYFNVITER